MNVHASASSGYEKGADIYAAGRPDYPPEVVDWLRGVVALRPGETALDVGAGTGKFLPSLLRCGARVLALEPVPEMRAKLAAAHPDAEALAGAADSIPLPDESVDAVLCAQAFHWFATEAALREMRRVLRPGRALGLVWNERDESVPWVAELARIVDRHEAGTPRFRSGEWRRLFPAEGLEPLG